jgi:DNA-binding transcriptional LysR family regulator
MDVDPHLLRVLRAIADTGSITAAADRLGYSQPAISQLLGRAERRFAQPLVVRVPRGVRLTEAGRTLAEHAVHVQAALDAAAEDLAALGGLTTGQVRIAGFPSASSTIVPRLLAALRTTAPGIDTAYVEAEPPEALAMLRAGEIDVAITFSYDGDDLDPDAALDVWALASDTVALVAPATSDVRSGGSVPVPDATPDGQAHASTDLADYRDARWIGGCPRCRGHLLASCAAAGFTPDIVLETDNAAAVLGLVAEGLGVALLPRLALALALATTIVPRGVTVTDLPASFARRVEVVVGRSSTRIPSVRATLDALRAVA